MSRAPDITKNGWIRIKDNILPHIYEIFNFGDYQYFIVTEPSPDGSLYPDYPPIYGGAFCLEDSFINENESGSRLYPMYDVTWTSEVLFGKDIDRVDDLDNAIMFHSESPKTWGPPNVIWLR